MISSRYFPQRWSFRLTRLIHPLLALLFSPIAISADQSPTRFPEPHFIPKAAEAINAPYPPQTILPGGTVIPLFPPNSPFLNTRKIHEAEVYSMTNRVPGRIHNIVNIHNPSIEIHTVPQNINTGTAIILIPGGGNKRLIVSAAGADFVSYFFNYGINCIILRSRLRADGYDSEVDPVNDTLQAIRLIRANADKWKIDPKKIGVMGFSAGAEHASRAAVRYETFDAEQRTSGDPLAGTSSRPDFIALLWPGPTPFTQDPNLEFPRNIAPAFIASTSYGTARHTVWAHDYYMAMLKKEVPNIEIHMYANGKHGGGLNDRNGTPFGAWQKRYIDWFRDLGFLQKPGTPTKAAADIETYLSKN